MWWLGEGRGESWGWMLGKELMVGCSLLGVVVKRVVVLWEMWWVVLDWVKLGVGVVLWWCGSGEWWLG